MPANVNPIVQVTGEVRGDRKSQFTAPETGEVTDRRRLQVLTSGGFIELTVPKTMHDLPEVPDGTKIAADVAVLSWSFQGKVGVSFILEAEPKVLAAVK